MKRAVTVLLLLLCCAPAVWSQINTQGLSIGAGIGPTFGQTELPDRRADFLGRAFIRYGFVPGFQIEAGVGSGEVQGQDYKTNIMPIDARLIFDPIPTGPWNPYLYAGIGTLYFRQEEYLTTELYPQSEREKWTSVVPLGGGLQYQLSERIALEGYGGYNMTGTTVLDGLASENSKDNYWNGCLGLTVVGESGSADPDNDGLTNDEEKELKTDKHNPDSDGDGLSDGDEVHKYHTDPLNKDTDGDGLTDGDEINKYHTDPLKKDTDGDGLSDYDEVMKYHTDPNNPDTDGDGLSDGDEINKYHTDPLKQDTDGDGLTDGEEVLKYHTDPNKADTDGGSVNDGQEVKNGTNPLDPSDDIKKEEVKVEVGTAIVLEGVVFETNKADLKPESEEILTKAYNTLKQNPDVTVEIRGYTDNTGGRAKNMKLSQARADAVKAFLVNKGISADRIAAKGYGPENPIAPNTTKEGKQKNRRIEFFRIK